MDVIRAAKAPKEAVEIGYRWVILIVALLAQAWGTIPGQAVAVFGPFMQVDFGLTRAELGLLQTAFGMGQIALVGFAGLATDRVGVRAMLLVGAAFSGIFIIAAGVGGSFVIALAAFTLVGVGSGVINPATAKAIMDWFPPRIRATAMGVKQTGVPFGGVLAGLIMPSIALAFGWRWLVAGLGVVILVVGIIGFILYREHSGHAANKPAKGNATIAASLGLLRRRDVLLVSFGAAPLSAVQFALVTYVILYLKEDLLYSIVLGGFILSLVQFVGIGGRIFWGFASDGWFRGNRLATMLTIAALSTGAMLALAALPDAAPSWLVCAVAVAAGLTTIGWHGVWLTQTTELVGRDLAGSVSGIAIMIASLGILLGPPVFGAVVDNTGSYRVAWLCMAGLCTIAFLLLLMLRAPGSRNSGASS